LRSSIGSVGVCRPIIPWSRRTTPGTALRSPRRSGSEPSRAADGSSRAPWPGWAGVRIGQGVPGSATPLGSEAVARRPAWSGSAAEGNARGLMESRIERLCVERGLKMTGQRRVIARVLSESSDHPDVEELYRRSAALDARISIATVYRTVRLLEEKGILERRDFGGGRARYEPTEHG